MKKSHKLAVAALGTSVLLVPGLASAGAPVTVNIESGVTSWTDISTGSSDYCGDSTFNIEDANITGTEFTDAFDGGAAVFVNESPYLPTSPTISTTSVEGGIVAIGSLDVDVTLDTVTGASWLRQTITITNPTASPVDAGVLITSNMGADSSNRVHGVGDGWFASADVESGVPDDAAVTFLVNGVNGTVKPSTTENCDAENPIAVGPISEDVLTSFSPRSIPAGATVRYVLFYALSSSIADAVSFGANADDITANQAGLFEGFTAEEMATIANWSVSELPETGSSTLPILGTALGLALAGAFIATLRRRSIA